MAEAKEECAGMREGVAVDWKYNEMVEMARET